MDAQIERLEQLVLEAEALVDSLTAAWTAARVAGDDAAMQRAARLRRIAWARRNRRQMAWAQAAGMVRL